MKKVISVFLFAVLFTGLVSVGSFAAESCPIEAHYAATGNSMYQDQRIDLQVEP